MVHSRVLFHSVRLPLLLVKILISGGLLALLLSRVELPELWAFIRQATPMWLLVAVGLHFANIAVSTWRWRLLLSAQRISVSASSLFRSYLVASFFNNFLPSNIGGDVVRIGDTSRPAGSKTLATTIVLTDRGIGFMGLVLLAAVGATLTAGTAGGGALPIWPPLLWLCLAAAAAISMPALLAPAGVGRLLRPLRAFHPEWVGERITRITDALARFRAEPAALASCFAGALIVQLMLVAFYGAVVRSMGVPISFAHLTVLVPVSVVVQMVPISVNGFGVREATFGFYFTRLGLPLESALAVSFLGAGLMLLCSFSGAGVYVLRPRTPAFG